MKTELLPVLAPGTVITGYDFLVGPLVDAIAAEPRRMRYSRWVATPATEGIEYFYSVILDYQEGPACDTVGCVAGWTTIMCGFLPKIEGEFFLKNTFYMQVRDSARIILGLDYTDSVELFENSNLVCDQRQGSPEHAARVIAHIRRFAEKHKEQLTDRIIPVQNADGAINLNQVV